MKLLIVGSRSITYYPLEDEVPSDTELIISGGARGVDTLAERYADSHGIEKLIIKPDYKKYGRRAPLIRNEEMVDICDKVLVIWDGVSTGTAYTVNYAKKHGKEIILINLSER